ncbi:hypothetical protein ELQ87_26695 [Streptomyces griseoviridis]|uniref:Uncharacterized protein n=1 Tax=Streptomyces griseoviridis TaxID=45398 RepID=A0A3Q9KUE1_STRGD|nr:hypothetical protein ELQ87_26695 [Streptomyces griseoviridis]QCN85736.1 hypothetical protein DDJ31_12575 [Streptomyces griseoviridis]
MGFRKPHRDETSPDHTCTRPEARSGAPLPSPRSAGAPRDPAVPHAETAYDHGVLGQGAPVSHSVLSPAQKVKGPA